MGRVKISEEKNKILETISILGLIVIALIGYFISNVILKKSTGNVAIFVDGQEITEINGQKIDINVDGTYTIDEGSGQYNTIEIKDKKIKCIDANCPDKICVAHGELRNDIDNDMIVCAPHKLTIQYN